ncbi:hypothetical protein F383_28833 [Gossypium arboreum]|uniref:Uncharacterized protein n=1 Tax=Gossypium arboreum TaxID=29729 RepID=A0A0B0PJ84_GOSAR|nr:hypothetical protein F383_28833 [Gossypium arboreum]
MYTIVQVLTFYSQSCYTFQTYLNRIYIHIVIRFSKCPLNRLESLRILGLLGKLVNYQHPRRDLTCNQISMPLS